MKLTAKMFWDQVEINEESMGEGAALMCACEMFGIEYGDWPEDDKDEDESEE